MTHTPPRSSDSSRVLALALGLGLVAIPELAHAQPEEDDEIIEDDEYDDLEGSDAEEEYDDPLEGEDEEEAPGASASGSASGSVSLGGGGKGKAKGKAKRSKKDKGDKKPKEKDERPFFERYRPTNHMINAGFHLGGFWRANNHGLFDRSEGPQPSIRRGNFDFGFHLEYMVIPYVGVGFESSIMPTSSDSVPGGAKGTFYAVRGHVIGSLPYRLTPTLAVGGGLLALKSKDAAILNGGDPAFHWGPGAKFYINDWIAVRIDGRHIVTGSSIDGNRAHHGELLVGAEVNIRLTKWIGEEWRAKRSDRDGDTIADYYDECPDEYGEDEDGCPLNRDSDNDGVPDRSDACPNEWGDGADGCPVPDKDGDGILDVDDACEDKPENYNGFEDTDGCPDELPAEITQFEGVLEGIEFATGKDTIRKTSKRKLDKVASVLVKYDSVRVEISGHTDDVGSRDDNMDLSRRRAESVKQYLVDKGVADNRISTRGAGPDEPIADETSFADVEPDEFEAVS